MKTISKSVKFIFLTMTFTSALVQAKFCGVPKRLDFAYNPGVTATITYTNDKTTQVSWAFGDYGFISSAIANGLTICIDDLSSGKSLLSISK